jgi:hypothetical protein
MSEQVNNSCDNGCKNNNCKSSRIKILDIVDLNGRIYFIPDKYIEQNSIGYEHVKLYKFILASVIDNHIEKGIIKDITKITKTLLNNYKNSTDKLFSYLLTGKINIITLSPIETNIINNIPNILIPKINPIIIECLE